MRTKTVHKNLLLLFFLLLPICWLFPYTGDDWAWGSQLGLERLYTFFQGYNGRYFGNIIVLILTRSNILKTLAMAGTYTGIVACIISISSWEKAFFLSCLLLAMTPLSLMRQAIIWTSGFSNYSVSIFLVLLFLVFTFKKSYAVPHSERVKWTVLLSILGFASTLIVEHVTLYYLCSAVAMVIYSYRNNRDAFLIFLGNMIGSLAGTVIMFSNSAYHVIANGTDDYRAIASGGLFDRAYANYFSSIATDGYLNNVFINLILLAICTIIYHYVIANAEKPTRQTRLLGVSLTAYSMFCMYSIIKLLFFYGSSLPATLRIINGVLAFAGLVSFITSALLIGIIFSDWFRIVFVVVSIIVVMAPLFIVSPIGGRCYFASYVMFILLACILAEHIPVNVKNAISVKKVTILCLSVYIVFFSAFSVIHVANNNRLEHIRTASEKHQKKATFVQLPFDVLIWTSAPIGEAWAERYKLFYNIPSDIKIIVEERDPWPPLITD